MEHLREQSYVTYKQFDSFCRYMYIVGSQEEKKHTTDAVDKGQCNFYVKGDNQHKLRANPDSRWMLYEKAVLAWQDKDAALWHSTLIYLELEEEVDVVLRKIDKAAFSLVSENYIDACGYSTHLWQTNNIPHIYLLYKYTSKNFNDIAFEDFVKNVGLDKNSMIVNSLRDMRVKREKPVKHTQKIKRFNNRERKIQRVRLINI